MASEIEAREGNGKIGGEWVDRLHHAKKQWKLKEGRKERKERAEGKKDARKIGMRQVSARARRKKKGWRG